MHSTDKIGADRLAYEVAKLILAGHLDSRSGAGDALLDYLEIGTPGKASSVPTWMKSFEKERKIESD